MNPHILILLCFFGKLYIFVIQQLNSILTFNLGLCYWGGVGGVVGYAIENGETGKNFGAKQNGNKGDKPRRTVQAHRDEGERMALHSCCHSGNINRYP